MVVPGNVSDLSNGTLAPSPDASASMSAAQTTAWDEAARASAALSHASFAMAEESSALAYLQRPGLVRSRRAADRHSGARILGESERGEAT